MKPVKYTFFENYPALSLGILAGYFVLCLCIFFGPILSTDKKPSTMSQLDQFQTFVVEMVSIEPSAGQSPLEFYNSIDLGNKIYYARKWKKIISAEPGHSGEFERIKAQHAEHFKNPQ